MSLNNRIKALEARSGKRRKVIISRVDFTDTEARITFDGFDETLQRKPKTTLADFQTGAYMIANQTAYDRHPGQTIICAEDADL